LSKWIADREKIGASIKGFDKNAKKLAKHIPATFAVVETELAMKGDRDCNES